MNIVLSRYVGQYQTQWNYRSCVARNSFFQTQYFLESLYFSIPPHLSDQESGHRFMKPYRYSLHFNKIILVDQIECNFDSKLIKEPPRYEITRTGCHYLHGLILSFFQDLKTNIVKERTCISMVQLI